MPERHLRKAVISFFVLFIVLSSCSNEKEHIAPAVNPRDSVSTMTSYGVNTLISDSGVIKYRIVAERWDVNSTKNPSRWTFICGIFMEQYDEKFNVKAYVHADTAWYYDQLRLWELRGRVRVRNVNGLKFRGEELFWDGKKHEMYSYKRSKVITPERTLEGTYFWSDENMEKYTVSNSKGSFIQSDFTGEEESAEVVDESTVNGEDADTASMDSMAVMEVPLRPKDTKRAAKPKPDSLKKNKNLR